MPLTAPEPVAADHVSTGFDSGQPALDAWLTKRALKSERDGGSRTYVVCDEGVVVASACGLDGKWWAREDIALRMEDIGTSKTRS